MAIRTPKNGARGKPVPLPPDTPEPTAQQLKEMQRKTAAKKAARKANLSPQQFS